MCWGAFFGGMVTLLAMSAAFIGALILHANRKEREAPPPDNPFDLGG
jgi:hypothetical protein